MYLYGLLQNLATYGTDELLVHRALESIYIVAHLTFLLLLLLFFFAPNIPQQENICDL